LGAKYQALPPNQRARRTRGIKNFLPGIFIVEGFGFDGLFGVEALYLASVEQAGQAYVGGLGSVGVKGFGYGGFVHV
jgi:hypothetical protein